MDINPHADKLTVIGHPISHSQSPALYRAAFDELGLAWEYRKTDIAPGGAGAFIESLDQRWRGISVTMPHKRDVIPYLNDCSDTAQKLGVVNAILLGSKSGQTYRYGYNTDVFGILQAIASVGTTKADAVLILGGGATATSALVAAEQLGAQSVRMLMRESERTGEAERFGQSLGLEVVTGALTDDIDVREEVLISALPPRVADSFRIQSDLEGKVLLDVAYDPWPTALAESWRQAGGNSTSGLHMLLYQALLQVRIFVNGQEDMPVENEAKVLKRMKSAVGIND